MDVKKSALSAVMAMGLPAAHGVDGRTFGELVSGLARSDAGALVEHILECVL